MTDIYDVRIDGGFPATIAVPCSGEACRLVGSAAPVFGAPQSVAFNGAGNPLVISTAKKLTVSKHKKTKKTKKKNRKRKARRGRKASRGSVGAHKANGRGR